MTTHAQASGAVIIPTGQMVCKAGPAGPVGDRITIQGAWLLEQHESWLPTVYVVGNGWYIMERLSSLPVDDRQNPGVLIDIMLRHLCNLWGRQHETSTSIDWTPHRVYVAKLLVGLNLHHSVIFDKLNSLSHMISWPDIRQVTAIHGDPTIENVMMRHGINGDDEYIITDPIPASSRMPATRIVDIGKIMQSLYGFESMRHDSDSDLYVPAHPELVPWIFAWLSSDVNECRAAYYMCAVHFLRLLPYHSDLIKPVLEVLDRVLDDGLRS